MVPTQSQTPVAGVKKHKIAKMNENENKTPTKRSYDMAFKQKVIACTEVSSNRGAARKFGVDERRVREWRKGKDCITANPSKKKRLEGGGRKPLLNTNLEGILIVWIETLRSQNLRVTRRAIQMKALEIHDQSDAACDFIASRGWLEKFFHLHGLSLRRRITITQRLPRDLVPKVVSFVMTTRRLLLKNRCDLSQHG